MLEATMTSSPPSRSSSPQTLSPLPSLIGLAAVLVLAMMLPTSGQLKSVRSEKFRQLERLCVLPESYEMSPDIFVLLPDAKRVGLTLMLETEDGLEPLSRSDLRHSGLTWYQCLLQGKETATRHLKTLTHEIKRDERKIVQYAHFTSENPLTASIFLSPDFLKRFEDTLGKEIYVAIPDRYNVFVFPKLSDSIKNAVPKMNHLYKEALYPVSREVLEVSKEGIRVIGKF
jgi:hypothetical protein